MNITNTPQFDNQDSQHDYAVPEQNPAMPVYPVSNYEELKLNQFYNLLQDEVNFMPASDQVIEGALRAAFTDIYRDLNFVARREVIMDPNVENVSQGQLNSLILEKVNQLFDVTMNRIADSVIANLSASSMILSTQQDLRYVVDETNAAQVASIILGIGLSAADTQFNQLIDHITDDQIEPGDYDTVFNYVVSAGPNALVNATNLLSTHIRNQGLTTIPDSADLTMKVSLLLQTVDTQEFFQFVITKLESDPSNARLVILELVKIPPPKGITPLTANAQLASLALDLSGSQRANYESLIREIDQINPIQFQQQINAAARSLNDATELPRDITNAALDTSRVVSTLTYFYSLAAGLTGFAVGAFTRNAEMAITSLITPAVGMLATADTAAGNEAFQSATNALREMHYNQDSQRQLAERQAQQRLSFTVRGSTNLANFFASSRAIQLINMNANPSEGEQFNLDNFERQLTDPLRSIYFSEFARNYSTNRPQLVQAMGEIAADYATLRVTDFASFVSKVAGPNRVQSNLLTDLSANNGQ